MKSTIISVATLIGAVAATKGPSGTMTYGSGSYPSSTYSADCPFVPSPTDFILFADNIQQVSAVLPNTAFLRSQDLYIQTALDFGTASSFTVPDFALGANCSLNLAIPSPQQIYGDLSQALFSGGGNLSFSQLATDLPSSGLTFNTLGSLVNTRFLEVIPGQLLNLAQFPCPPPGTQLPGIIQSVDTTAVFRDALGPVCLSGLFVIIEGVGNPPVSPPPPSSSAAGGAYPSYTSSYYPTGTHSSRWSS